MGEPYRRAGATERTRWGFHFLYHFNISAYIQCINMQKHIHLSCGIEQALNVLYIHKLNLKLFIMHGKELQWIYICQRERGLQSGSCLVAALAQHLMTHTHLLVEPLSRLFLWGLPVWGGGNAGLLHMEGKGSAEGFLWQRLKTLCERYKPRPEQLKSL